MIEIERLCKSFGRLAVLKEVSCALLPGNITAIVGPNASGKSTLIKCVLGMVRPDCGDIRLAGHTVLDDVAYRQQIGYMAQIARFPDNLTVHELFALLQQLRGCASIPDDELFAQFRIAELARKPLRHLSGGTRQKVNAALALMFAPAIVLLDEPTVGMDPLSAAMFKDKVRKQRSLGRTVVLTSHIMSEVEELADRLVFLLEGRVCFQGTLDELRLETGEKSLEKGIVRLVAVKK